MKAQLKPPQIPPVISNFQAKSEFWPEHAQLVPRSVPGAMPISTTSRIPMRKLTYLSQPRAVDSIGLPDQSHPASSCRHIGRHPSPYLSMIQCFIGFFFFKSNPSAQVGASHSPFLRRPDSRPP